ncbi:hypothetical protein TWF192_005888 [Orbilia oligospora]|uniref:Uncharacterized protein n=1 Tax=Orbilia oligospora TaxID=2813651 RepID=A0A6G1MMF0_ORBOL|nr:hypothetical protein TWF191_002679 [Orbilia oligospora]KAF3263611.1 hypothetical protein TWF192_005888 [Orbilia oligospora]
MSSPPPLPHKFNLSEEPDLPELQQQIHDLTQLRNSYQASLLSLRSTKTLKDHLSSSLSSFPSTTPSSQTNPPISISPSLQISDKNLNDILLARSAELSADHQEWTQEALYRMAGLTKFSVTDPSASSPSPFNNITGIRIEVMADGKFGTPYYLFLKPHDDTPKPTPENPSPTESPSETHLILHRHTIPAYFIQPLNDLAEKYLPPPPRIQNLDRFVRDVRHFLVLHYLRRASLSHIKNEVYQNLPQPDLDDNNNDNDNDNGNNDNIPNIYVSEFIIDPEARLVEIHWLQTHNPSTKRLAYIALTEEGGIEGLVVKEDNQRILHMEMQIKGPNWLRGATDSMDWIPGLFQRLQWSSAPPSSSF